jgi:rhodanese-related sulfurtransferase
MQFRNRAFSLTAVVLLIMGSVYAQGAKSDKPSDDAKKNQMSAKELKQRLDKGDKVIIVDARHNLNGQIIKNAVHVPVDNLAEWAKSIDKNAVIVTYCTCPHDEAAEKEVKDLLGMGFANAYSLMGGLDAARNAGIDIVPPKE